VIGTWAGERVFEKDRQPRSWSPLLFNACSELRFESAGSRISLLEDRLCGGNGRESCCQAYRQNPTAHLDYVSQVFDDVNRCIEAKG
jgi:hypothetical protein